MAGCWVQRRETESGVRWRVLYRIGGRESSPRFGGSFETQREAKARQAWVLGEIAAMRVPVIKLHTVTVSAETFRDVAERWRVSRRDVADGTAQTHQVNLGRINEIIGDRPIDTLGVQDVEDVIAALTEKGLKRESIRKTRSTLAMVLDYHGLEPNPARSTLVKLQADDREELTPPTAKHLELVIPLLPWEYRLPSLVLDGTGMRVGELEGLVWGDVDEQDGRWRIRSSVAKTRKARWVPVPAALFDAVRALVPREDRDLTGQVFAGFGADRYRTAITRACKASGMPLFSPHDLRHRRATLWHLWGVPVAEAAAWLGHSPQEHLKTYAHATLVDRREIDHSELLEGAASAGIVQSR
jgi:integrase